MLSNSNPTFRVKLLGGCFYLFNPSCLSFWVIILPIWDIGEKHYSIYKLMAENWRIYRLAYLRVGAMNNGSIRIWVWYLLLVRTWSLCVELSLFSPIVIVLLLFTYMPSCDHICRQSDKHILIRMFIVLYLS